MKARSIALAIVALSAAAINLNAYAGPNDFFGSSVGGAQDGTGQGGSAIPSSPGAQAAAQQLPSGPPSGDYTADEKRVQKKYKENMRIAQRLVSKGEGMMKSGDEKTAKKGRILKEIGEKRIAELKANNPFPEFASRETKKVN